MKLRLIPLYLLLGLSLVSCGVKEESSSVATSNKAEASSRNIISEASSSTDLGYTLNGFNKNIKTDAVINPGMGFYRTRYLTLKRETGTPENDFSLNGFYHVRIDISDFSKANNGDSDYDITESALKALDNYFIMAEANKCSLIIRFAYDGYQGKANMEPTISKMKDHIASLSTIINQHTDLIIAIECGLIGPWGEMHTSTLDVQSTYNELFPAWLSSVNELPILSRKPRYVYKYMGYTLSNLDSFTKATGEDSRLGSFNDGYYGDNLDTGTYESLEARTKETIFLGKLGNVFGGECIGEPSNQFSYDEVIDEMNLVNLTYLNYEWNDSLVLSWKDKAYDNTTFYNYMVNHMGFKLYVDNIDIKSNNDELSINIDFENMGFSHITRDLKAKLIIESDTNTLSVTKPIRDDSLSTNIGVPTSINNAKIYLELTDNLGRSYELMNGTYEANMNYLGKIIS